MIIEERIGNDLLRFEAQPGVFAHRGLDEGTKLLIECMEVSPKTTVLDLGCGYEAIGITSAHRAQMGDVLLFDSDIRATRLAERNLERNGVRNARVLLGDGTCDPPAKTRYDLVACNPPTYSGREVLNQFVQVSYQALRPRGHLYLVINRLLSLRREVDRVFGNSEISARQKGFVIICTEKQDRRRAAEDET